MLIGVLDDDSESGVACRFIRRAEDPNTRPIHLNISVDAFTGSESDDSGRPGLRDRIAIERQDVELMAGKRDGTIFHRAGVQQVDEHTRSRAHTDGLTGA